MQEAVGQTIQLVLCSIVAQHDETRPKSLLLAINSKGWYSFRLALHDHSEILEIRE